MAAAVPIHRGMEAAGMLFPSFSDGAAAAIARGLDNCCRKQSVGFHSNKPSSSSSSSPSCSSSSCYSSCCISRQSNNHGPSSRLSPSPRLTVSSAIKARKRKGKVASQRAPQETTSQASKVQVEYGQFVPLRRAPDTDLLPVVTPNLRGAFVGLTTPDIAPVAASCSSTEPSPNDAACEVGLAAAEASGEAIEDSWSSGPLSATLSSLIRVQEAKLFGPSNFNASKLRVLLLGKHDDERPLHHPRIYTLTHSDLTAKITLAVAREINKAQVMGWYSKLQRDEVVAEWRRTQGEMSLHVHCHISGTNFLHRLIAKLRFYIFQKELPLVLEAFIHGDGDLFKKHPELQNAPVWVYFHSNVEDYNRVECWGHLVNAAKRGMHIQHWGPAEDVLKVVRETEQQYPGAVACLVPCDCCSRHETVIPIPESLNRLLQQTQLQQQNNRKGASQSSYFFGPT